MQNFGGNVTFHPRVVLTPRSEEEVLAALRSHRGRRIRASGRLHSWSPVAATEDVLLDLRYLNQVELTSDDQGPLARVGAGCQMKRVIAELERAGLTTPSLGLITEQAIAGATATGTHGSGKHSLSHYVCEVRLATYDAASGAPIIVTLADGDELRAARCSLGCLGIVLTVSFRPRPQYRIEEWTVTFPNVDDVLAAEAESPLQQFYLIPWAWRLIAQRRKETVAPRSWLAPLYRAYFFLTIDVGLHLAIKLVVQTLGSPRGAKLLFRHLFWWGVIRHWRVVDTSHKMLVMEHELFRHIEMELFVKRGDLPAMLAWVQEWLTFAGTRDTALTPESAAALAALGLQEVAEDVRGAYVHHYPICVRTVHADDTLISMASGADESHYAVSIVSYQRPKQRASFFAACHVMAAVAAARFGARPHWGKHCPLEPETLERLYPGLPRFRELCRQFDPSRMFANDWATERLGLDNAVVSQATARGDNA